MYAKNKTKKWSNSIYNRLYRKVEYDENYNLFCTNPNDDPEDWKFSKINDIIYDQNGFKTWADAKKKWGADWKEQRYKLAAQFAFDNRDNVYLSLIHI